MTKAKVAPRRPVVVEPDETNLPPMLRRRPWLPVLIVGMLIAVALGGGLLVDQALKPPLPAALASCKTSTQIAPHRFIGAQPICINAASKYDASINTSQGVFVMRLHPEVAPVTVNNFIVLAIHGYYDGLTFWKSEDWVVQGGDPGGDGRGGPGYFLPDEPNFAPGWNLAAVGMARVPGGAVNGSQFFIEKAAWPDPGPSAVYNRFGTVTSGMDKVQLLQVGDKINSITIKVS